MLSYLKKRIEHELNRPVPATGLGIFRLLFGLVILQEVLFLIGFRHLIFDTLPYIDRASPVLHYFLVLWAGVAACLTVGYKTRWMALWNYVFWVIFVVYTPMWQDFDGGFDQFMTGSSFLLLFLPADRALSLDNLAYRLRHTPQFRHFVPGVTPTVSRLAYTLPVAIALGLLYLDSGLHKLASEFWRNGLGAWLPPTMPYYMSALDLSPLLNNELLEKIIGYSIITFQWVFIFLFWFKPLRLPLLLLGVTFHGGIILALNIYPFGFGMLVHYALLVPFGIWQTLSGWLRCHSPALVVFYDEQCPLCNRTAHIVHHFDIRRAIEFRGLQTYAADYPSLAGIPPAALLRDLYSLDRQGTLRQGVATYGRLLVAMGYLAPLGGLMALPGVRQVAEAVYRRIADGRARLVCDADCSVADTGQAEPENRPFAAAYARYAATPSQQAQRISKFLVLILLLQGNSTLHYALLYRWADVIQKDPALTLLDQFSDAVINVSHTFLGITPHALYLHDHFAGYDHLLAITWFDADGQEHWLPFIDETGRILSPHWGRIQSMWANVAVTSKINLYRLEKLMAKVSAFHAHELGLSLQSARFGIKLKEIHVPMHWEPELRHRNMAAPWRDIGAMVWQHGNPRLEIDAVDLEALTRE